MKTNPELRKLIEDFGRRKEKFYKLVSKYLSRPRRQKKPVNLSKIDKVSMDGDVVVVPGKLLAHGELTKKLTIYAFSYSKRCEDKIKKSGSDIRPLGELLEKNIKGRMVI